MISELAVRNHLWQALLPADSASSLEAVSLCLASRRLFFLLIYLGMDPKVFTPCPRVPMLSGMPALLLARVIGRSLAAHLDRGCLELDF